MGRRERGHISRDGLAAATTPSAVSACKRIITSAGRSFRRSLRHTVRVDVCRCPGLSEGLFVEAGLFCVRNVRQASGRDC